MYDVGSTLVSVMVATPAASVAWPKPIPSAAKAVAAVVPPVPPFAIGSVPVMASESARLTAPKAYVLAPVHRSTWPTVDDVFAVKADVPFPWTMPVRVEAPVPPFATEIGNVGVVKVHSRLAYAVSGRMMDGEDSPAPVAVSR